MFYDLSINRIPTSEGIIQYKKLLQQSLVEGYGVIAHTITFSDYILLAKDTNSYKQIQIENSQVSNQLTDQKSKKKLVQLSRMTIEISEPRYLQQINQTNKIVSSYDLIALKPKNEKMFHSICTEYDVHLFLQKFYDIITFDMGQKIPFMLKRNPVYQAIRRGKFFEITYNSLYDNNKKRICLTNAINIIKATKGKNLIVSSQSSTSLYHRSGYDLMSLLITLGLKKQQAIKCVKNNPQQCVKSSKNRKCFKGIITLITDDEKKIILDKVKSKKLLKLQKMEKKLIEKQNL